MKLFENSVNAMVRIMYYIAGLGIVVMMAVTVTDVFLRFCVTMYSTFHWSFLESWRPVPGTYDIVAMAGSITASFAMAHTTVQSGHVAVSLLVRLFSKPWQTVFKFTTETLSAILFATLSYRCVLYARDLKEYGEVTMTLQLPFYPFVYLLAFSAFAVTLVFIMSLLNDIIEVTVK